jgi:hypothetical protein
MLRLFVCFAALFLTVPVQASDLPDGEYDATVQTSSGTYTVPVEVESGEVSSVHWPNGGNMSVRGADIYDGSASGYNSRGDRVNIEIDDYSR